MAQFSSSLAANAPNISMMQQMYSTTFGNMAFEVLPASPGEIQAGFPTIPDVSLEALLYSQQMSNPMVSPTNVITGNTSGAQNINGQQTVTDDTGTVRMVMGYSQSGF